MAELQPVVPWKMPKRSLRIEIRYRNSKLSVGRIRIVHTKAKPHRTIAGLHRAVPSATGFFVELKSETRFWRRPAPNAIAHRVSLPDPSRNSLITLQGVPRQTVFTLLVPYLDHPDDGDELRLGIFSDPPGSPKRGLPSAPLLGTEAQGVRLQIPDQGPFTEGPPPIERPRGGGGSGGTESGGGEPGGRGSSGGQPGDLEPVG